MAVFSSFIHRAADSKNLKRLFLSTVRGVPKTELPIVHLSTTGSSVFEHNKAMCQKYAFCALSFHAYTHRAGRTRNGLHRSFYARGIEVGHFLLGYFAHLRLCDAAGLLHPWLH